MFLRVYTRVAERIGESWQLSARQARRWRNEDPPPCPHPHQQRVIEVMFGLPLERCGFDVPEHRRHTRPPHQHNRHHQHGQPEDEDDTVDRRSFVTAIGGSALTMNAASGAAGAAGAAGAGSRIGSDTVHDLREGLNDLYSLDDRFGGAAVGPLAARHLTRIERLLETASYTPSVGRQLQVTAGETLEHVAWLAYDAGDHDRARVHWNAALSRSRELEDEPLRVLVMASLSLLDLREGRPRDALDRTRAAGERARGWAPRTLLSILASREARALALLGEHTASRAALARAARLFEQGGGGGREQGWTEFYGAATINQAQASLFSAQGHHRAAVDWLRKALGERQSSFVRSAAYDRFTLAAVLARTGEGEEGMHQYAAGRALLGEVSSGRVRDAARTAGRELRRIGMTVDDSGLTPAAGDTGSAMSAAHLLIATG